MATHPHSRKQAATASELGATASDTEAHNPQRYNAQALAQKCQGAHKWSMPPLLPQVPLRTHLDETMRPQSQDTGGNVTKQPGAI